MERIILASASPRRREILELMGLHFDVMVSGAEEDLPCRMTVSEASEYLALKKARDISSNNADSLVLGADTIVSIGGKMLGKPRNEQEAFTMLRILSGKTHSVYTGVALIKQGIDLVRHERTMVKFSSLSDEQIHSYIQTGEPMDKAGAYGIQGFGGMFIEGIRGCYFNVMGLPMHLLYKMLLQFNIKAI